MLLRLICTDESLVNGPGYLASGESYRIGRSSSCSFVVKDLSASRFHAEVTAYRESVLVKDLGSRNGTFVNGVRVEEAELKPGQAVRFGTVQFQLIAHDQPGSSHVNSELSTFLINPNSSVSPAALDELSDAQKGVLALLLEGRSEKDVAKHLHISQHTVHNHVKSIYKRMGVNSRPELLALFVADSKKAPIKPK